MKKTDQPIGDHFEDVLEMVTIGAGTTQAYEKIVGLNVATSQPVIICHGFKGGDKLSPPLLQRPYSDLRNYWRSRLEWRRRGHS